MKIHVVAKMNAPHNRIGIGGTNKPVFKKEADIEVPLTPALLVALLEQKFILDPDLWFHVESYDSVSNVLSLTGYMDSLWEDQYRPLIFLGWKPDQEALHRYGMYFPE